MKISHYLCYLTLSILVVLGVFANPTQSRASHAAGAELIYEWVSGSTYRFYLKFYRDCGGISESNTIRLCYFNSCSNQSGQVNMNQMTILPDGSLNSKEVSPGCPQFPTKCSGGSLPGFREIWYEATVTLPSQCDYWTFYSYISARNTNSNITSASTLYVEATLNNLNVQQQSSPWFSTPPVPYVCINSPHRFNNGAVDPDKDSLSFEFIHPRTVSSTACVPSYTATDIPFRTGFSLSEPFATNNTFQFDPVSGQMSFTPTAISANTVAVRVNKWRNGEKLGSVMRDIQIQVLACNVVPPTLDTVSGSFQGSIVVNGSVEGSVNQPLSFCYTITSNTPDGILMVNDNSNAVAPGSSTYYSGVGTNNIEGCFNWTPSCSDTGMRILTITVKDSTCKPPGVSISQTFSIPIYIRSGTVVHTRQITCAGEPVTLRATGTDKVIWSVLPGGSPLSSLSCTNCPSPEARPDVTTVYEASSSIGGCKHTDRITVVVDNDANEISITPASPYVICEPDTILLEANITGPKPIANLTCGTTTQLPATTLDTIEAVPPHAEVIQSRTNPASTPFPGSAATSSRHQYLLKASDLIEVGMHSGTIKSLAFHISSTGGGAVYDNMTISMGCTSLDKLDPAAGFIPGTELVYTSTGSQTMLARGGWVQFDFDTYYNWDTTQNLIVDICFENPRTVPSVYTYFFNTDYQATIYTITNSGSACSQGGLTVFTTHELPKMRLGYHYAPEYEFPYKWTGTAFFPNDTASSTSTYVNEVTRLMVSSVTRYGCTISDTLEILFAEPFTVRGNTSVCEGSSIQLHAENGSEFRWYENGFQPASTLSCDDCPNPIASPTSDIVYTVVGKNIYDCIDTVQFSVSVRPLPQTRIITDDQTIRYGEDIQLEAIGAERYTWSPISGLSQPNMPVTNAHPKETTVYTVVGEIDGCFTSDSIRLVVDFTSKTFIPTAFSPNGDGKNDVFRVSNIQFEKLQEFKIFNRWGTELFTTTDPTQGWDGTYNGIPQDPGVYHYIIQLAYPDGTAKVLKGTVTLVR